MYGSRLGRPGQISLCFEPEGRSLGVFVPTLAHAHYSWEWRARPHGARRKAPLQKGRMCSEVLAPDLEIDYNATLIGRRSTLAHHGKSEPSVRLRRYSIRARRILQAAKRERALIVVYRSINMLMMIMDTS